MSTPPNKPTSAHASRLLKEDARREIQMGNINQAHDIYLQVIAVVPSDAEASNFLAMYSLARENSGRALKLLEACQRANPADTATFKNLGIVLLQTGDYHRAKSNFLHALDLDPDFYVARLYLGLALDYLKQPRKALSAYFQAITLAQQHGQWTSEATTPAGIRNVVGNAMRRVHLGRRRILHRTMETLCESYGKSAMIRVEKCLSTYLNEAQHNPPDQSQKPSFLYFPDIPSTPYFSRKLFPWYEQLESNTEMITNELLAVTDSGAKLLPFLGDPKASGSSYLTALNDKISPQWDGYFFYRHGYQHQDNCEKCPNTFQSLNSTTIVRIDNHAPEALFSVLGAHSHILPHHGVTNTRSVTHLPLIVPDQCAIKVSGEVHNWKRGQCITFDDTFVHEAWNKSADTRVILLFDVWNPYLSQEEQLAITDLVSLIGELNDDKVLSE